MNLIMGSTEVNSSMRYFGIAMPHINNEQKPIGILRGISSDGSTQIVYGGGSIDLNPPTLIEFYAGDTSESTGKNIIDMNVYGFGAGTGNRTPTTPTLTKPFTFSGKTAGDMGLAIYNYDNTASSNISIDFLGGVLTGNTFDDLGQIKFIKENIWSGATTGLRNSTFILSVSNTGNLLEVLRADHYGRVGINTTSPSQMLDVQGNINSTGTIWGSVGIFGPLNRITGGEYQFMAGLNNEVSENYAIALGTTHNISASYGVGIGTGGILESTSTTIGINNQIRTHDTSESIAIGTYNIINDSFGTAFATNQIAIGLSNIMNGYYSTAIGFANEVEHPASFVLGAFNKLHSADGMTEYFNGLFGFGLNNSAGMGKIGIGFAGEDWVGSTFFTGDPSGEIQITDELITLTSPVQMSGYTQPTCNVANEGMLYYNSTTHKHYGCNSTDWNAFY